MAITAPNHSYGNKSSWQRSVANVIPAALYWSTLAIIMIVLACKHEYYWIIVNAFNAYNIYFFGSISLFSALGIKYAYRDSSKDHYGEYLKKKKEMSSSSSDIRKDLCGANEKLVEDWESVMHYVIIANYKEEIPVLKETLDSLAQSTLAKKQMIIVLAMEQREENHQDKASSLISMYSSKFKEMFFTSHPANLEGEFPGKASNVSWAFLKIQNHVEYFKLPKDKILITVCDADSNFHSRHFENLNLNYCLEPNRHYSAWQSPMISYRNFDKLPLVTKMVTFLTAVHEVAQLADPTDFHHLFSTYHIPYHLVDLTGGMDGDAMAEDHHIFVKAYFSSNGKVKCRPLHIPIGNYAVDSPNYWKSLSDRLEQAKRHLWGGIKCWSYVWYRILTSDSSVLSFKKETKLPLLNTIRVILQLQLVMFDATFSGILPIISAVLILGYQFNPDFPISDGASDASKYLPFFQISSILQIVLIMSLPLFYSHWKLLQMYQPNIKFRYWKQIMILIIGFSTIMPIVSLVLGTIPAFWAVSRLVFTEHYKYVVAPKPSLSPP
jgi:hypothetical protein